MVAGQPVKKLIPRRDLDPPLREGFESDDAYMSDYYLPKEYVDREQEYTLDNRHRFLGHLTQRANDYKKRYHKQNCDPKEKKQRHLIWRLSFVWSGGCELSKSFGAGNNVYDDLIASFESGERRTDKMEHTQPKDTRMDEFNDLCEKVENLAIELALKVRNNPQLVQEQLAQAPQ